MPQLETMRTPVHEGSDTRGTPWPLNVAAVLLFAAVALMPEAGSAQSIGDVRAGRTVAAEICAECHAIDAEEKFSSNFDAPHFDEVANTPGMTSIALRVWLQSSHPTMPNIILNADDTADVIAYILSLKQQ